MLSRLIKIAEEFNVAVYMTNQGKSNLHLSTSIKPINALNKKRQVLIVFFDSNPNQNYNLQLLLILEEVCSYQIRRSQQVAMFWLMQPP